MNPQDKKAQRRRFRRRVMRPLTQTEIGEPIFVASDGRHITLSVKVAWSREYVELNAEEVAALLKFLREVTL